MCRRDDDFKLLTLHGKLCVDNDSIYRLRNDFFYIGGILLKQKDKKDIKVRLLGYKVPMKSEKKGGKFIALLGYDSEFNPYIFEMKSGNSPDKLKDVVNNLNEREKILKENRDNKDNENILKHISREVKEKLFWECFRFTSNIKKVLLADREYYKDKQTNNELGSGVIFCAFDKWKDTEEIKDKAGGKGFIEVDVL